MVDKKKRLKPIEKTRKGDAGRERLEAATPRSQVALIVPPRPPELTQIEQPLFGPPVRPREFTPLRKPHFWNEKLTLPFLGWAVIVFLIFFETMFIAFILIRLRGQ